MREGGLHAHELARVVRVLSPVRVLRAKLVPRAFLTTVIAPGSALAARFCTTFTRLGIEIELNLGRLVESERARHRVEIERVHVVHP